MPYGIYLSAAGANAQNHRLEVLSHNLANINTPGFKSQLAVLQARHSEAIERGEVSPGAEVSTTSAVVCKSTPPKQSITKAH